MQNLNSFKGINSSELRGFFTGLILGDGHIDKGVHKRAITMRTINKDFADFISYVVDKNTVFKHYVKYYGPTIGKDGTNHKEHWYIAIKAHPYFNKMYHYFYNDYRHRKVYAKTLNWLNPVGLACWYMSDGYVCLVGKTKGAIRDRRMDICTDRYFEEDIDLMISVLRAKFGIVCSKVKRGKFRRIRIKCCSYEKFINIIKPYIVDSMLYKLYLGYENKPDYLSDEAWEYQQYLLSAVTPAHNGGGQDIV
jgi:LAGLIDADG DNA endonuclease family